MHMLGTPRTMQRDPRYRDVVAEVAEFRGPGRSGRDGGGRPREDLDRSRHRIRQDG